jgi:dienelactone hydrolase
MLWLLLLVQVDDLVVRAVSEENPGKRSALVAELRKRDPREVEKSVRALRGGPLDLEVGKPLELTLRAGGEDFTVGVHVPAAYDASTSWPLLLTLHGANRSADPKAGPAWLRTWLRCAEMKDRFILVSPTTTKLTWGNLGAHERIFAAMSAVLGRCNVDPDRVYCDGMSMGAGGAFNLAERYPDRWAAIAPRCGAPALRARADKSLWAILAENFRNVPQYVVFGAKDAVVPVAYARAGKDAVEALKYPIVYREHPEGGHEWGIEKDADVVAWLEKQKRPAYPEEVVWKTHEKPFARAYWVEVVRRSEKGPLVTVHMDIQGKEAERRTEYWPASLVRAKRSGNSIELVTEEVKELKLRLSDAMVDLDKPVVVTWNGRKVHDKTVKRSVDVLIEDYVRRRDPGMTFTAELTIK